MVRRRSLPGRADAALGHEEAAVGQWLDRVQNHVIHNRLREIAAEYAQAEEKARGSDESLEAFERLRTVVEALARFLRTTDPSLVLPQWLNTVDGYLATILAEIRAYATDGNVSRLANANAYADNALLNLPYAIGVRDVPDLEGLNESVASYRRSIAQYLRHTKDEVQQAKNAVTQIEAGVAELRREVDSQKGRLDTALTQHSEAFARAEEARRAAFAGEEASRVEKASAALEALRQRLDEQQDKHAARFDRVLSDAHERLDQILNDITERVRDTVDAIERKHEHVKSLVSVVANTGMVGGFQRVANEEKRAAFRWRILAVVSMVGLIAFALSTFFFGSTAEFSWPAFASRVFATLTFGLLAGYAARQAQLHQKAERDNRRLELEIQSLDPFLAELPEATRVEVKRELADRWFAQREVSATKDERPVDANALEAVVRLLVESMSKK